MEEWDFERVLIYIGELMNMRVYVGISCVGRTCNSRDSEGGIIWA
jgi:hypothetical protein